MHAVLEMVGGEVTWACLLAWVLAVVLGLQPAWPLSPAGRHLLYASLRWSFATNLGKQIAQLLWPSFLLVVCLWKPQSAGVRLSIIPPRCL